MAKFKVIQRPTGLINGRVWPRVGEVIDLPRSTGEGMTSAGFLEPAPESRPAKKSTAKKAAAKPAPESRPANSSDVETREKG